MKVRLVAWYGEASLSIYISQRHPVENFKYVYNNVSKIKFLVK